MIDTSLLNMSESSIITSEAVFIVITVIVTSIVSILVYATSFVILHSRLIRHLQADEAYQAENSKILTDVRSALEILKEDLIAQVKKEP